MAGCGGPARPVCVDLRTEYVMGTLLEVRVEADDSLVAARAVDSAFAVVRRLDRLLSNYDSASELSRIGRIAPGAMRVSPPVIDFIEQSIELAGRTGGAVDFTIEPVVRLWGFYGDHPAIPDSSALARALGLVDYRRVAIDRGAGTVRIDSGMALDPGAAGKGFALAAADRALTSPAIRSVYFDFGGQIFRRGSRSVEFAVRHPRNDSAFVSLIRFASGSVATSGDQQRCFEAGGERYGHILDPRTGRPVRGRWSVSVWHPDPFTADGLATALFVLGPDRADDLLAGFPDAAALFVEPRGDSLELRATPAWESMEVR
jgi:thiamine biosynthesis lipoprotein